mgnify:CR=1 FL=1
MATKLNLGPPAVSLLSAIVLLALGYASTPANSQIQIGPQYRGVFVDGESAHTGGVVFEALFPQEGWAWGIELDATTNSDIDYWANARLNAGLLINKGYLYGSFGTSHIAAQGGSDSGELFGVGVSVPLSKSTRLDLSTDMDSSFEGVSTTASLRYVFPTRFQRQEPSYSYKSSYRKEPATQSVANNSENVIEVSLDPVIATNEPPSRSSSSAVTEGSADSVDSNRIHPMKIAIQEGCNVTSVEIVDGAEVWGLFCPKTLQRLTVTL